MVFSNIVDEDKLREVQLETMEILKKAVSKTFGPYGSNTIIGKDGALSRYTKDGHTVLSSLQFVDPIAKAVHTDIEEETRTQAQKIGDSTTSITILSAIIFKKLTELQKESNELPVNIVRNFKYAVDKIIEKIKENGRPATIEDMYDIALIATNDDEKLSNMLLQVYKEYGLDVYIDVKASMNGTTYVKEINGMTLDCGFLDPCLINNPESNSVDIANPKIYAFKDPIDTAEMGMYLDIILQDNIIKPLKENKPENIVATIIMAPRLSRDYSSYIDMLMQSIAQAPAANRGMLNIITGIQGCDEAQFGDICDLCNCKYIKKYLDEEIHKKDIKAGLAPTRNTIHNFAGTAELVKSDAHKTTFVNPDGMYKKDGTTSDLFNQRIDFLQGQIDKLTVEGNETTEIYNCKKRLNSLKGKMVEIYIGGVTVADRDAERDLMEDAVLNCRSAALNGVGYAANFEGFRAANEVKTTKVRYKTEKYFQIIFEAYLEISEMLYATAGSDILEHETDTVDCSANGIALESLYRGCPYNLISKDYDGKVLTSIDTDICILETISKIVTIMVTANQFILPTINMNQY